MAFKHFWVQYKLGKESDQAYVKSETFVIGRAPECDLPIPTDILSRRHLKVYLEDEKIHIMDLGSTNGTYLQGERLKINQKYEYKTGNRLYLDAGKECSIRITAIFQRDIIDYDLEQKGLELEKKKRELRGKGNIQKKLRSANDANEVFVANASASVDNIFENLIYIAKSARYNKEKKIREAENISQEMLEKAQKEIETQRALLEKELKALQVETKKEANRLLKSANEKAAQHMKKVEDKARKVRTEALEVKEKAQAKALSKKQEIIEEAQERGAQIIADAHIKNKELKEENEKIDSSLASRRQQVEILDKEIDVLRRTSKEQEELTIQTKDAYSHELSSLNALKAKVLNMEKRNAAAIDVLESKIPNLEKKVGHLDKEVFDANIELKKKETEYEKIEKSVEEIKQDLIKHEEKKSAGERRLDELSTKIIDTEDNLFRLNKIKQQRNEEIDREIAERREKQKSNEERSAEKIAKKKERAEREIELNLANAKEKALSIVDEANKEANALIANAQTEADRQIEERLQSCDLREKEANEYADTKRKGADNYSAKMMTEAEEQSAKIIAQAKLFDTNLRSEVEQDLKDAKEESQRLRAEARLYEKQTKDEADEYASSTREEADIDVSSRRKNLELEIQEAKDRLLSDSRKEAKDLKQRARKDAETIIETAQMKADEIMEKVQGQADKDLASLQQEIEDRKKETDAEIQAIRSHAVQKMEEQKKQMEREELERNRIRVLKLRKDLNEVLRARISPYLKDEGKIEKISQVINKSINAILLDEVDDHVLDAEDYSDIDPTLAQNKVKKFWMAATAVVVGVGLFFLFLPNIKDLTKDTGRSIANKIEKEDQAQIAAVQKAHDLSAAFNPEMKEEFLATYTDRVLYTKNYLKLEKDPGFKNQWRLELEEFFVDELRKTENQMIPFFTREAALIKELGDNREKVNGNFVEESRDRMLKIEENFFKRIKQDGLKKNQIEKIKKFKKKFFEENKDLFS